MQRILVCAQDPVLAKKVRFLMERDECKVEIVGAAPELEGRLRDGTATLLVLSRHLDGADAVDWIDRLDTRLDLPTTLILGGEPRMTADFVHLLPDPVDTQAIYREASRLLSGGGRDRREPPTEALRPSLEPPDEDEDEDIVLSDVAYDTEDEHVRESLYPNYESAMPSADDESVLDRNERDDDPPRLGVEDEPSPMEDANHLAPSRTAYSDEPVAPEDAARLDPAAFARALHRAWSNSQDGALIVEREGEQTTIYLDGGQPVHVASSRPGDPLGRALVERGRLTEAQYADAAMRAIERGTRLSDAVVALGYLSEDDLGTELGASARELLVGCFAARPGRFWRDSGTGLPTTDRPYRLEVGQIIAEGLRSHADDEVIDGILGDRLSGYFKLRRPPYELQRDFPLSKEDTSFLEYEGRAYNVEDAADGAGLPLSEARRLMAILAVCDEVEPFIPTAREFEDRIREERDTRRQLESQVPRPAGDHGFPRAGGMFGGSGDAHRPSGPADGSPLPRGSESHADAYTGPYTEIESEPTRIEVEGARRPGLPTAAVGAPATYSPGSPPAGVTVGGSSSPGAGPIEPSSGGVDAARPSAERGAPPAPGGPPPMPTGRPANGAPAAPPPDQDIPPMPTPPPGEGVVPRPLAYAKPQPRAADGSFLETAERALSRDHFQRGVSLLGKGNFSSAEEAFRDAVALCSEEHVYLIGLARAIYYNPGYRADGKVPILRSIVERAKRLAPDDKRVATLEAWVSHAEAVHPS